VARPRTPRSAWIEAGLRVLADGGPGAVRIEVLAESLGVTKGGFYGYFADRNALLAEMLDRWEHEVTDSIIERVDAAGGDARERLRNLFRIADTREGLSIEVSTELAIRDWSRRDAAVEQRLRRVDNLRMDYLRSLFREFCADEQEVELRCTIVTSVWLAGHLLTIEHGAWTLAEVEQRILERMLE
jgi:AcrR family transcriptional regulator